MKRAIIHLPYFKQGDDLRFYLAESNNNVDTALQEHVSLMEAVAEQLRAIRDVIRGQKVKIDAGAHHIGIRGRDKVIDRLIAQELAEADNLDEDWDGQE